jgi:hypothetical protein
MLFCQHFNRAWRQFVTTASRAIGLSENANNLMPRWQQRVEVTRCEVWGSSENNP